MIRLLCAVLIVVIVVIFAMDNMHHVELGLFVGKPVHVRLFFLLLISSMVGCLATILINLFISAKFKKKTGITQDTEEDDFFSD